MSETSEPLDLDAIADRARTDGNLDEETALALCDEVRRLRAFIALKSPTKHEQELAEATARWERSHSLLRGAANGLKGQPPDEVWWDLSDMPERSKEMRDALIGLRIAVGPRKQVDVTWTSADHREAVHAAMEVAARALAYRVKNW